MTMPTPTLTDAASALLSRLDAYDPRTVLEIALVRDTLVAAKKAAQPEGGAQ